MSIFIVLIYVIAALALTCSIGAAYLLTVPSLSSLRWLNWLVCLSSLYAALIYSHRIVMGAFPPEAWGRIGVLFLVATMLSGILYNVVKYRK